ncbi:MAG: WD40 repeat domain-containing protein, partial [Byssovorax sp.]
SAAWSPDGARVLTTSLDHTARVWSADGKGEPVVLEGHGSDVYAGAWAPDGQRVATSSADGTVRLWSADGEGAPIVLGAPAPVIALAFLDGGQQLLTVTADNGIHTWMIDVDALKQRLLAAHTDCLTPDVRTTYLGETASVARDQYTACERSYQRAPLPLEAWKR